MNNELISRYTPFIDEISLNYQYDNNIKHLLYLIIPSFIKKYGYKNERLILDTFKNTRILILEDNEAREEAFYTSIPKIINGKVNTEKRIVLRKYSTNSLVQLLDNLVHEFNHAINSYKNEIRITNNILFLRTGLTNSLYTIPELKPIQKEKTYILEEILNTTQTEDIINIIKSYNNLDNELSNTIYAINQETNNKYKSNSYYLETILFKHILENKTFISTLNNLRLSGSIDSISEWFDNITGIPNSYNRLNDYLVDIMNLELELNKKKYFKNRTISKIKDLLEKVFSIIDTFDKNCHYR